VFVLLVVVGFSAFALNPRVQRQMGMSMSGVWFVDAYAVLAASDAVQAGLDPFQPNPLDVIQRPHSYSSWWFLLGKLGFNRQDNPLVGGLWVGAFLAAGFVLLRPRTYGAALWGALLLLSPPVLLAMLRANNDLVVFVLLAAGVLAARSATPWRLVLFAVGLTLATGLKFYPIIAGLALLLVRPPRLMFVASALTLLSAGGVLFSVRGDLRQAAIPAPDSVHTLGAPVVFHDLGWASDITFGVGVLLLIVLALLCWSRGWYLRLDDARGDGRDRLAFACGAALLVGCFLAGISHAYRFVFVLFLAPQLWRAAAGSFRSLPVGLTLAVVWFDGLYCLAANVPLSPAWLSDTLKQLWCWRLVSQPLVWVAMASLAASLLEMVRAAWADGRKEFLP
jgi:hypothetical protein